MEKNLSDILAMLTKRSSFYLIHYFGLNKKKRHSNKEIYQKMIQAKIIDTSMTSENFSKFKSCALISLRRLCKTHCINLGDYTKNEDLLSSFERLPKNKYPNKKTRYLLIKNDFELGISIDELCTKYWRKRETIIDILNSFDISFKNEISETEFEEKWKKLLTQKT